MTATRGYPQLDSGDLTSRAMVQQHLAGSRVVKACNNIVFHHLLTLARPPHSPECSALPIASDSHNAKEQVAQFLNVVGYDTVEVGSLSDSWRSQANTPVYRKPYMPAILTGMSMDDTAAWIFRSPGIPAPASKIKALISSAVPVHTGGDHSALNSHNGGPTTRVQISWTNSRGPVSYGHVSTVGDT